ncbi:MAG TPA: serine hydrolase domain-containing protein [Steroidobacteraceae bacterium]|nr:serine hydrolase domain-containing protein [Steroidobacteraceae bacterium]
MNPTRRCALLVGVACTIFMCAARPDATSGLCEPSVVAIDASIRKTMSQGAPGMIVGVARHGQPLFVRPYGTANLEHDVPIRRPTVFKLASVTKQFTAAAVLRLVQRRRLSLDDKLARFVPELPQASTVTLRQLLVHTSGLPDYAEDPEGQRTKSVARSSQDMVAWIARLEPKFLFQPGTRWAYSNSNYALLGAVVERISGKSLEVFFREELFQPAGLTRTGFDDPVDVVAHRAQGYRKAKTAAGGYANAEWISPTIPGAAGGLRTTVDDLLRWSHALFSGTVLPPATLRQMIAPGTLSDGRTTKFGMPEAWQRGLDSDYGMGVFITNTSAGRRVWHSGDIEGFSTWLAHYPEAGVTIAVLQNSESADIDETALHEALFGPQAAGCEHRRPTMQSRPAP